MDYHKMLPSEVRTIQQKLLKWYRERKRALPWRDFPPELNVQVKAYRILVSEIMLQQTKVATVIPYYQNWIEEWPTLKSLSSANMEDVLNVWKGLGYYSRARRLWKLAQLTDEIPEKQEELSKLPGIGPYTSGAVSSIAFGEKVPAVDGNVTRVLCRLRAVGGSVSSSNIKNFLQEIACSLVPEDNPGDWNQALMELGATVCSPKSPNCVGCPLNGECHSFKNVTHDLEDCDLCLPRAERGRLTPLLFPVKKVKTKPRLETQAVCVIHRKNEWYLVRNNDQGILAELWQFPSFPVSDSLSDSELRRASLRHLKSNFHMHGKELSCRIGGVVDHKYSHIWVKYRVVIMQVTIEQLSLPEMYSGSCWVSPEQFNCRPVSVAMQKIFELSLKKNQK